MKRLGMILRSGMPLMEGLRMLADASRTRPSSLVYESLIGDVAAGRPLSAGMRRFERHFGSFCISLVQIGEASGTLRENIEYLADEMKRTQALKRKVFGALIYPAVIIAATFLIVVMLTVYIFPKIVPIFQSVKATLPFSTRLLVAVSDFLGVWGWWLLAVFSAAALESAILMRNRRVRRLVDRALLRLPLIGALCRAYNLTNICRTMSLLLKSDVRIVESMDLVVASTRNLAYRDRLLAARGRIIQGRSISVQFGKHPHLFPALVAQMLAVGESTGDLSGSFAYLSLMYEEEIDDLTKNLTTLLEPILMIMMGLVVGWIAISIITPIYSITQHLTPQ